MTEKSCINQKRYGDWQNSSYLPMECNLNGEQQWFMPVAKSYVDEAPYHLCLGAGILLSVYTKGIVARIPGTGELQWTREFVNTLDFTAASEGIQVLGPDDEFFTLSFHNEKTVDVVLPVFSNFRNVLYVVRSNGDYLYTYNRFPESFDSPNLLQGFTIQKYNKDNNDVSFEYDDDAIAECFVLTEDMKKCILVSEHQLYSFPVALSDEKEISRTPNPSIRAISRYHDGSLLICQDAVAGDEKREPTSRRLTSMSEQGKVNWEVPLDVFSKTGQPPAFTPEGPIYYCAGNTLLCVDDGSISWKHEISAGKCDVFLTVLKDRSVLAAVLNKVLHFTSDGELLQEINAPFVITCRPIVDEAGVVYVAGKEGCCCFK